MNTDTYRCDICGFEAKWDETDEIYGDLWSCESEHHNYEICGNIFCSKCFMDKYGYNAYIEMMRDHDYIKCPDCYVGGRN